MVRVAIVTGANKGIGFGIVRGLCKRFEGDVFLTSRDVCRGQKAVEILQKEGLNPKYHQLDVTDTRSLEIFRDFLKKNYSGIDILINNVGIAFRYNAIETIAFQAEQTLSVNYFSLVSTCDVLLPLLKNGGKLINVSSSKGHLSVIPNEELRNRFRDPNLSVPELNALMRKYIDDVRSGMQAGDWGRSSYRVSKVGVTALTMIQQRDLRDKGIIVNAVHPGYVGTDMTNHKGFLSIDEGAVSSLYAALYVSESLPYKYIFYNNNIVDWTGPKPKEIYN